MQTEGLVCAIRNLGFLFQTTPAGVVAEPNQVALVIGHLPRYADLVAVEVVGLLSAFAVFADVVQTGESAFVRTTMLYVNTLHRDWRFRTGYDLLIKSRNI